MNKMTKNRQRQFSKALKGQKIVSIDATAVNVITFHLENGKVVELETEYFGHGVYGISKVKNPEVARSHPASKVKQGKTIPYASTVSNVDD